MSEDLKAIAVRMPEEVFNQGKLEVVDEIVDPDFVDHGAPPMAGMPAGRDGIKALAREVRKAFPDLNNRVDHVIAEGDLVVLHVTTTGTMKGEFSGMPPSGKQATWEAMHITRMRGGKLLEHWVVQDQLGMLAQLGFVEAPGVGQSAR